MWQHWINLLAGIWLVISPYVGFTAREMTTNLIISGIIVGGLALWAGIESNRRMTGVTR